MKLQPDRIVGVNAIQASRPDCLTVNGVDWRRSLVLPWVGAITPWFDGEAGEPADAWAALTRAHFERLAEGGPELVIFGSGQRLRFAPPALMAALHGRRIGVETMDTAAACRTYNILVGEGRKVVAGLLVSPA